LFDEAQQNPYKALSLQKRCPLFAGRGIDFADGGMSAKSGEYIDPIN
jgi:hypothetical protein